MRGKPRKTTMARKKTTTLQLTDQDLVQRKLSGTFCQVTVDVPWAKFDDFGRTMIEILNDDYEVDIDLGTALDRKGVKETFEKYVSEFFDGVIYDLNDEAWDEAHAIAHRAFAKEIQDREDQIRKEREEREAAERAAEAARRKEEETNGVMIRVTKKNAKKAEQILRAAGLIK